MSQSWEAAARRCFRREEERRRARKKERRKPVGDERAFLGAIGFAGMWLVFGLILGSVSGGLFSTVTALLAIRFLPPHLRISRRLESYRAGEQEVLLDVYRFAADEFRGKINAHRQRTLGPTSKWGQARSRLVAARDDADRSIAYWRRRRRQHPDDPVVSRQSETANRLGRKLTSALHKLDGRADVLRKFYHECEARVSVMDRCNQDLEETRRLEKLSGKADMVIAEAADTLAGIGASFVREADRLSEVLVSFERLQLETLAGEVAVDEIEILADRINESAESHYDTVEELTQRIEQAAEPIDL